MTRTSKTEVFRKESLSKLKIQMSPSSFLQMSKKIQHIGLEHVFFLQVVLMKRALMEEVDNKSSKINQIINLKRNQKVPEIVSV